MKKFSNLLEAYIAGGCTAFAIENFLANNWLIAALDSVIVILIGVNIAINIKNGDL